MSAPVNRGNWACLVCGHDVWFTHSLNLKECSECPDKTCKVKEMREQPESLEEQAAQEGYVPEYQPDEEPADDFPYEDSPQDFWNELADGYLADTSDPYDIEYDVP